MRIGQHAAFSHGLPTMTDPIRRRLLQAGLATTLASLLPPAIARAAAIAPAVRSGSLEDLRHVVILMQENRSFDHYFGTLYGVRGFGDRFAIPAPPLPGQPPRSVWLQPAEGDGRPIAPFPLDTVRDFRFMRVEGTPHSWPDAQAAWDHGRMGRWPDAKHNHSLGYFRRGDIPFQFALAETFTLCDAYHCAIQSSTNPNRVFLWCGHNDAEARAGGPVLGNSHDNFPELGGFAGSYTWKSYAERLQAAGVSWQIYQDMADNFTDNPLAGFESFRRAYSGAAGHDAELRARGVTTRDLAQLRRDVLEGKLPQVSYIVAGAKDSEHPSDSSPAQGAAYTARVLDALTADPAVWSRTALLVMFDENDGFFDHVPPPAPPSADPQAPGGRAGASAVALDGEYHLHAPPGDEKSDIPALRGRPYGLGARVPMYVVSPWSRGGWVDSQVYDHTSVLRLLERRFGVAADISPWRRAVCGDLTAAFDFSQADARPFFASLPSADESAARAATLSGRSTPPTPAAVEAPVQDVGVRRSRALPYRPEVRLTVDTAAARVGLSLSSEGAASVLHVYDRLQPAAIPRRFTVAPGKPLADHWSVADGRYDLWVLGPNGFHRHFSGRIELPPLEASLAVAAAEPLRARLQLRNPRTTPLELRLVPGAYPDAMPNQTLHLAAGESREIALELAATGGWYDLWLTADGAAQRLAGRMETGRDSISDPALGGPAPLRQASPP
jgi:phospholipase C